WRDGESIIVLAGIDCEGSRRNSATQAIGNIDHASDCAVGHKGPNGRCADESHERCKTSVIAASEGDGGRAGVGFEGGASQRDFSSNRAVLRIEVADDWLVRDDFEAGPAGRRPALCLNCDQACRGIGWDCDDQLSTACEGDNCVSQAAAGPGEANAVT